MPLSEPRVARFIYDIKAALSQDRSSTSRLSIEKRLLKTVAAACGSKVSRAMLSSLSERLATEGLYTEPPLDAAGLKGKDWIFFSTGPFPPDSLLFPRERDLVRFVSACIGSGVFRDLRPFREGRRIVKGEFRLPSGLRIDMLCEEKPTSAKGAIVAIELKQGSERGVVSQMVEYLSELRQLYPTRAIRGIIITGRDDAVGSALLRGVTDFEIEWYCYEVGFRRVAPR